MNIRKADSKGRLTGFVPGQHYTFAHVETDDAGYGFVIQPVGQVPIPVSRARFPTFYPGAAREGEFVVTGYEKGYD